MAGLEGGEGMDKTSTVLVALYPKVCCGLGGVETDVLGVTWWAITV